MIIKMEKNNIKYFIVSIILVVISLSFVYNSFSNNIYVYETFDITGISKIIQITMSVIILIISIICLIKAIQSKEKGVDYIFNKCILIVFIIYMILSVFSYIYIRSSEEKSAIKMKEDITQYSETFSINNKKDKKLKNLYNTLSYTLAESEYMEKDEFYGRKKEIINQVENSSTLERYISMLFLNYSYDYYSSVKLTEIQYYGIFLKFFLIGICAAGFYLFNINPKDNNNVFYDRKDNM